MYNCLYNCHQLTLYNSQCQNVKIVAFDVAILLLTCSSPILSESSPALHYCIFLNGVFIEPHQFLSLVTDLQ